MTQKDYEERIKELRTLNEELYSDLMAVKKLCRALLKMDEFFEKLEDEELANYDDAITAWISGDLTLGYYGDWKYSIDDRTYSSYEMEEIEQ